MTTWKKEAEKHSREVYPEEACGLVVETSDGVIFYPVNNSAEDRLNSYKLNSEDYAAAEDIGKIIGLFHSHPDAPPTPSHIDKLIAKEIELPSHIVAINALGETTWFTYIPDDFEVPLIGREWAPPILDCYGLIRDYYKRELNIELPEIPHDMGFDDRGENLYLENCEYAGFVNLGQEAQPQNHDLLIMQIRAIIPNHGGIYIKDYRIRSENAPHQENCVLHHLAGRLSKRDPFVGYWREHLAYVFRHKELL